MIHEWLQCGKLSRRNLWSSNGEYFIKDLNFSNFPWGAGDFPSGPVVKNPPSNAWDTLDTKIPHATGQLSLSTTTREKSLWAATKTGQSQKKIFFPSDTLCYKQKLFKIKMNALCTCSTLQKMLKLFFRFRNLFLTSVLSVAGEFQTQVNWTAHRKYSFWSKSTYKSDHVAPLSLTGEAGLCSEGGAGTGVNVLRDYWEPGCNQGPDSAPAGGPGLPLSSCWALFLRIESGVTS